MPRHWIWFRCGINQDKTNCYPLAHHTWKMLRYYLVKCTTFSTHWRYVAFLQTLVALKRTGCEVRQMECQASSVTANVQSDHLLHGYMLPVFFSIKIFNWSAAYSLALNNPFCILFSSTSPVTFPLSCQASFFLSFTLRSLWNKNKESKHKNLPWLTKQTWYTFLSPNQCHQNTKLYPK